MSRCICVLGTGRSGSSATAGMLHKLGVPMGESFVQAPEGNPEGTFEDAELMTITQRVLAGKDPASTFRPAFEERARQPLWGFKIPAFIEVAHLAMPILREVAQVRLVIALRPREACIDSYVRAYGATQGEAARWFNERYWRLNALLSSWDGPTLDLWWPTTKVDPMLQACRLLEFVFDEGEYPSTEALHRAADHIR